MCDLAESTPAQIGASIIRGLAGTDAWRQTVLNLLAGEGVMSRTARSLLGSDIASRLSEGRPGQREIGLPTIVHEWPDETERAIEFASSQLFAAGHVEWRAASNTMANAIAMSAMARRGDRIAVQSIDAGGNVSYQQEAIARLLGFETLGLPGTGDFEIDATEAVRVIVSGRPRLIVVGGSKVLFPYPLEEIRAAADAVGALLLFDAAHLGPLIAAGLFPQPLHAGAHVMTTGTHKLMGGPVGGLILTDEAELAGRIRAATYPQFLQTRDLNKYGAAAISLLEMLEHHQAFATATLENARSLASALNSLGIRMLGAEKGFTQTHMLFADAGRHARQFARGCEESGILLSHTSLPGEHSSGQRSGIRISVAQITRHGMQSRHMPELAELVDAAGRRATDVRGEVARLAQTFSEVGFSFDEQ